MTKVLLVDDDNNIRTIAMMGLEDSTDWELVEASSGNQAIEIAQKENPDLILLDMMMPGLDGKATLSKLRENDITSNIPVIFMTAKVQTTEIEHYKTLGVHGVIIKPFDPTTLADDVRKIVSI